MGRHYRILTPQRNRSYFSDLNDCAKFHQILFKIATAGAMTDTQIHRQTDAGDLIICPMLCYSNGTDNNCIVCQSQLLTISVWCLRSILPHTKSSNYHPKCEQQSSVFLPIV